MDVGAKKARPLTRPGVPLSVPSPDGSRVATWEDDGIKIYPIGGGKPRTIPGADPLEWPLQWRADGRALYLGRESRGGRCRIDEVDLATGRRGRWKELRMMDPAGSISIIGYARMTPNGEAYAYSTGNMLSALYLVEGLR